MKDYEFREKIQQVQNDLDSVIAPCARALTLAEFMALKVMQDYPTTNSDGDDNYSRSHAFAERSDIHQTIYNLHFYGYLHLEQITESGKALIAEISRIDKKY